MQYEIEAGDYRATVTELGAGLRELLFREQPVIVGYPSDELPPAGGPAARAMAEPDRRRPVRLQRRRAAAGPHRTRSRQRHPWPDPLDGMDSRQP